MKNLLAISLLLLTAVLIAYLIPDRSPVLDLGGDDVSPRTVRAGQSVTVVRNFRIRRRVPMRVLRTMVRGDCRMNCRIIDLSPGSLSLDEGDYMNVMREHKIPENVPAGEWVLRFSIFWEDRLGRETEFKLAPLSITVEPREKP